MVALGAYDRRAATWVTSLGGQRFPSAAGQRICEWSRRHIPGADVDPDIRDVREHWRRHCQPPPAKSDRVVMRRSGAHDGVLNARVGVRELIGPFSGWPALA